VPYQYPDKCEKFRQFYLLFIIYLSRDFSPARNLCSSWGAFKEQEENTKYFEKNLLQIPFYLLKIF
jgi:hypothetical protein